MAKLDCVAQDIFWYCVLPVVTVMLIWKFFSEHIKALYGKFFAWMLYTMTNKTAHMMRPRKLKLFCELHDVASANSTAGIPFEIAEIGSGSGANFEYYPKGTIVNCVDPNPNYEKYLRRTADKYPDIQLKAVQCGAEDMSHLKDNSMDAVVGTLVLCSVNDVETVLEEIIRILKPVSSTSQCHKCTVHHYRGPCACLSFQGSKCTPPPFCHKNTI